MAVSVYELAKLKAKASPTVLLKTSLSQALNRQNKFRKKPYSSNFKCFYLIFYSFKNLKLRLYFPGS